MIHGAQKHGVQEHGLQKHGLQKSSVQKQIEQTVTSWPGMSAKAQLHHLLPESGWISYYIRREEDIAGAIELFERSYKLAVRQKDRKQAISNESIA
jgi:Family of unknown function (DUF5519)